MHNETEPKQPMWAVNNARNVDQHFLYNCEVFQQFVCWLSSAFTLTKWCFYTVLCSANKRWTREESLVITRLSDFGYLVPFRIYSRSKSEVTWNWPKFCMFLAHKFCAGDGPPNFWTCIIKRTQIAIMWQSFMAIGRRTSEISWRKEKTSAVKHKAFRN